MVTSEVFTQSRWCFFVTVLCMLESSCCCSELSSQVLSSRLLFVLTAFRCTIEPPAVTPRCVEVQFYISLFSLCSILPLFVETYLTPVQIHYTTICFPATKSKRATDLVLRVNSFLLNFLLCYREHFHSGLHMTNTTWWCSSRARSVANSFH